VSPIGVGLLAIFWGWVRESAVGSRNEAPTGVCGQSRAHRNWRCTCRFGNLSLICLFFVITHIMAVAGAAVTNIWGTEPYVCPKKFYRWWGDCLGCRGGIDAYGGTPLIWCTEVTRQQRQPQQQRWMCNDKCYSHWQQSSVSVLLHLLHFTSPQTWTSHCAIVPWHRRPLRRTQGPLRQKTPKVTYPKHNTNSNPKPNTYPNNKRK